MKVLKKLNQQDFPKPTHIAQRQQLISLPKWLLAILFFCTTWTLQGQWVYHIDCPCDMYPAISISEHSGLKEHDRLICRGEVVTITATGGHKYQWSTGDTTNTVTVDQAGGYAVTISDASGCQVVENVLITEYSRPYLDYKDSFCSGYASIKVKGTGIKNIIWNDGSDKTYLNVTESGTYSATIKDEYNCTYVESAIITKGSFSTVDIQVKNKLGQQVDHTICKGEVIDLHASSGFIHYQWSSSDGTINSTSATLLDEPTTTTTYTVLATDASGCTATKSITIFVNELVSSVSPDATICKGSSIQLLATGGQNYSWSPTTGLSDPTISNPIASSTVTTVYSVVIKNSTGCEVTKQVIVYVTEATTSIEEDVSICLGESVRLSASGGVTYAWSPSASLNDSTLASPVAIPSVTTTYNVLITDANGCTATQSQTVTVDSLSVDIQGATNLCTSDSLKLEAVVSSNTTNSVLNYAWNSLADSAISSSVVLPSANSGIYMVTVTDNRGCTAVDSIVVTFNDLLVEVGPDISVCLGDSVQLQPLYMLNGEVITDSTVTYAWSPSVGINDTTLSTPTMLPASTTTYTVTVTDTFTGCTTLDTIIISVEDLQIELGVDTTICLGDSLQLSSLVNLSGNILTDSLLVYSWSPNIGITDTTIANPTVFPDSSIIYTVMVTNADGCTAVDNIEIIVNDLQVDIGSNQIICPGSSIQLTPNLTLNGNMLTGSGSVAYSWSPVIGIDDNTAFAPAISLDSATTYILTVRDSNGCIATDSILIDIHDTTINATVSSDSICKGDSTQLNVTVANSGPSTFYIWMPSDGLNDPAIANPMASPDTTTTYIVEVIDENNCTVRDTVTVEVLSPEINILSSVIDTICARTTVTLDATGNFNSYTWIADPPIDNGIITNQSSLTLSLDTTTTFSLEAVDDATGCIVTTTRTILVYPDIKFGSSAFNPGPTTGNVSQATIEVSGGSPNPNLCYLWSVTSGDVSIVSDTETNDTLSFIPNSDGFVVFNLLVTDKNTGCSREDIVGRLISSAPPPIEMATLSGRIFTETGSEVENTTINLTGYSMPPEVTGGSGNYAFEEVPMYEHYLVTPKKESNPLNGVTTLDLILISKHILGTQALSSPYQLIAADVNRSGTITVFDIVALRKLILRTNDDFANNTSWRFVDADYQFKDPTNPFREHFPENYPIQDLQSDMTWLDFIGVKIGDVNNSAAPNSLRNLESRNRNGSLMLNTKEELLDDGQTIVYHFSSANTEPILGYQFALEFDLNLLEFDQVIPTSLVGEEYFGFSQTDKGILTSSWNRVAGIDLSKETALFSLAFKRKGKELRKGALSINSNKIQAEAYSFTGAVLDVQLADQLVVPEVAINTIKLYQNRPNPFTGMTAIGFNLPEATTATLRIFDTSGKVIKTYEEAFNKGYNELIIKSTELTEFGALYYQLATPTQIATKKMIHTR